MTYVPSYLAQGQKCVVCGDEATGLHYKAITCEGCKGFFRRVCQRKLNFICKENEKCEINKTTRNLCQRCRLLKCLANGMSSNLVLNEEERTAKRQLIERNREHKKLEKIQIQLHRHKVYPNIPKLSDIQKKLINILTDSYCNEIDIPLKMKEDFTIQDSIEQLNLLFKEIIRRTFNFVNSLSIFRQLNTFEQEHILIKSRSWLEIQLLRTAHRIDLNDGSLIPSNSKNAFSTPQYNSPKSTFSSPDSGIVSLIANNRRLFVKDLIIEPHFLLYDIQILAEIFQKLNMDNEQLAILSAILIFQPEFLPNNFDVKNFNSELWLLLQFLVEQNPTNNDASRYLLQWPRLHINLAQLQAITRRHFSAFFNELNACELARLFV